MNGILLLDKPIGMTSHDVVYKARKALGEKRIGHTGTLDPMASGLLVLCVGSATKLVKYFTEHDKTYDTEITIGYMTDTLDREGTIVRESPIDSLSEETADQVLHSFIGNSMQIPPEYSAIHVQGKKLYEYARKNLEMPTIEARPIEIYEINRTSPLAVEDRTIRFSFSVHCGKGMYVRSLCRDIGLSLDSCATMTGLRREQVGQFDLSMASTIEDLQNGKAALIDPLLYLDMPWLRVDKEISDKVKNGVFLSPSLFASTKDTIICDESKVPLAIYTWDETINKMRLSVLF